MKSIVLVTLSTGVAMEFSSYASASVIPAVNGSLQRGEKRSFWMSGYQTVLVCVHFYYFVAVMFYIMQKEKYLMLKEEYLCDRNGS